MKIRHDMLVRMVPIAEINILNTRSRGKRRFEEIVVNIAKLGLKKPVLLARKAHSENGAKYDLVCGEGRINAFKSLGEVEVPALVIDASREEALLMSLAENIARKPRTNLDMAREIAAMRDRGDKPAEIAKKVDMHSTYVVGILRLLKQGENRLITAIQQHRLPMSVAISISGSDDEEIQRAMTEAYEKGTLRGRALQVARRIIERRRLGKKGWSKNVKEGITAQTLLKAYKRETARQQMLQSRARLCETRLRYVASAVKKLMGDEGLVNLLRAEGLSKLPQYLAAQTGAEAVPHGA